MTVRQFISALAMLLSYFIASPLSAALINPASITATASTQLAGFNRLAIYAVNGAGLLTATEHENFPNGFMWLSTAPGFGGLDASPYFQVDLGAVYALDNIHVWNYNEVGEIARGVNSVTVLSSTTDATLATNINQGTTTIAIANGTDNYTGVNLLLAGNPVSFTARYIRFQINSNHGDTGPFYGLAEVQFFGVPVPEPSAFVLMLFGMCALRVVRKR